MHFPNDVFFQAGLSPVSNSCRNTMWKNTSILLSGVESPAARCSQSSDFLHSPSHSSFLICGRSKTKQEFWRTAETVFSYLFVCALVCLCRLRTGDPETCKQTLSHAVPNSLSQKWTVPAYAPSSVFQWCSPSGPGRRWNLLSLCSSSSSTCTFKNETGFNDIRTEWMLSFQFVRNSNAAKLLWEWPYCESWLMHFWGLL